MRARLQRALCNDSTYNSESFLQQTGGQRKAACVLEPEGQSRGGKVTSGDNTLGLPR